MFFYETITLGEIASKRQQHSRYCWRLYLEHCYADRLFILFLIMVIIRSLSVKLVRSIDFKHKPQTSRLFPIITAGRYLQVELFSLIFLFVLINFAVRNKFFHCIHYR